MNSRLKQDDLHEVMTVLTHTWIELASSKLYGWGSHEDGVRTIDAVISVFSEVYARRFAIILEELEVHGC